MKRPPVVDHVRAGVSGVLVFWWRSGAGDPAGAMHVLLVMAMHEGGSEGAVRHGRSDRQVVTEESEISSVIAAAIVLVHR